MEMRLQNTCEQLYWETAKRAVLECKLAVDGVLQLCRSIFRVDEEQALESRYGHLFAPYGEGDVGGKILDRMVALSIPAYRNDLGAIEDMLDDPYHSELNAHYYLKTGRVIAETYALPAFDWAAYHALRELDSRKARALWETQEEKKRAFFLAVAEELWDFPAFFEKYGEFFTQEELETYRSYCKKVFIEERIFLQAEWLLFSCAQWRGKEGFLYEDPRVDFFCRAHGDALEILPSCALQSKAFKGLLAKKYKIKY